MNVLKVGQVWKEPSQVDYGDIIRWKVVAVGKRVASIQNLATMKELAVLHNQEEEFTGRCNLVEK